MNPDAEMEAITAYLGSAVAQILEHEDPDQFLTWVRETLPTAGFVPCNETPDDIVRAMALHLGRTIWNATPLPGHGLRPRPLPAPGRNDRCPCGAIAKYKRCCGRFPSQPTTIDSAKMMTLVLENLSPEQHQQLVAARALPIGALVAAASAQIDDDQADKAVQSLEPLFAESVAGTDRDLAVALHVLCEGYERLGRHRQERSLINRLAAAPQRSLLRSQARLRLAEILRDEGEFDAAWAALRGSRGDAPNVPGDAIVEVQLLLAEGRPEEAHERASILKSQLQRDQSREPECAMIDEILANAMDDGRSDLEIDLESLDEWLDEVRGRPIPTYQIGEASGVSTGLADRLRQMGIREDQIPAALTYIRDSKPMAAGTTPFADARLPTSKPNDAPLFELTPPRSLRGIEQAWHRCFPDSKPFGTQGQPIGESHAWDPAATAHWIAFLVDNPTAFDSLDVLDDLATALIACPIRTEQLLVVLERAMSIVERVLARAPHATLPWVNTQNRPALRPLVRMFAWHWHRGAPDTAEDLAQLLLRLNPEDNHGMRAPVMNCLLRRDANDQALALAALYPDDLLSDMKFGRILAWFRTGSLDLAEAALPQATRRSRVPEYLVKKRVSRPKMQPEGVLIGGRDEAWLYRQKMRSAWKKTAGALEWLEQSMARLQRPTAPGDKAEQSGQPESGAAEAE